MEIVDSFSAVIHNKILKEEIMKNKEYGFTSISDLKIFLLYVLDHLRYPVEEETVLYIAAENTNVISIDYNQCLAELADTEHVYTDEFEGTRYYMISDKGRATVANLYDALDKSFLDRCTSSIARYLSLKKKELTVKSYIEDAEAKRFRVVLEAFDRYGDIMRTSITVNSMAEAVEIKNNYDARPDGVYKGILFSVTGKMDFLA